MWRGNTQVTPPHFRLQRGAKNANNKHLPAWARWCLHHQQNNTPVATNRRGAGFILGLKALGFARSDTASITHNNTPTKPKQRNKMKTFFNAIFQVAVLPFVLAVDWLVLAIKLHRLTGNYNAYIFAGV